MEKKPKILYVEDDEVLGYITKDNLQLNSFDVTHCEDGESAIKSFSRDTFDICIIDVMLPKMDGFTLAGEIRNKNREIPILFLTAKSLKEDKLKGLKLGADDYITKPFSIEELILKIQIFLRRKYIAGSNNIAIHQIGNFTFEHENLRFITPEGEHRLTKKEADLLKMLIENKNKIVERSAILERLWGENDYFMGRSMDVFISRLRKLIKADENISIENIHGVGFRLNDN